MSASSVSFVPLDQKTLQEVQIERELLLSQKQFPLKEGSSFLLQVTRNSRLLGGFHEDLLQGKVPEKDQDNRVSKNIALRLQSSQDHFLGLVMTPSPGGNIATRLESVGGLEAVPAVFREAISSICVEEVLQFLSRFLKEELQLIEELPSKDLGEYFCCEFALLTISGGEEGHGSLYLPEQLIAPLLDSCRDFTTAATPHLGDFSLTGEIVFASTRLGYQSYQLLQPGALVMLDRPSALENHLGTVSLIDGDSFTINIHADELMALQQPLEELLAHHQKSAVSSSSSSQETQHGEKEEVATEEGDGSFKKAIFSPFPEEALQMRLDFSAGEIQLTLDQLMQLQGEDNEVEEPSFGLTSPIKILSQGVAVGSGELTFVGDQPAIFITKFIIP